MRRKRIKLRIGRSTGTKYKKPCKSLIRKKTQRVCIRTFLIKHLVMRHHAISGIREEIEPIRILYNHPDELGLRPENATLWLPEIAVLHHGKQTVRSGCQQSINNLCNHTWLKCKYRLLNVNILSRSGKIKFLVMGLYFYPMRSILPEIKYWSDHVNCMFWDPIKKWIKSRIFLLSRLEVGDFLMKSTSNLINSANSTLK